MTKRIALRVDYRRAAAGVVGCLLVGSSLGVSAQRPEVLPTPAPVPELRSAEFMTQRELNLAVMNTPAPLQLYEVALNRQQARKLLGKATPAAAAVTYTVQEGDTFWSIAAAYGTDIDSLMQLNPDVSPETLQVGQVVTVMPGPGASPALEEPRVPRNMVVSRSSSSRTEPPVTESEPEPPPAPEPPPPSEPANGSGDWIWPITGGLHSSEYGPRWGGFHSGLDIAVPVGTRAVAARSGTVTFAGWDGGYGYCILIDHGDGFVTRYAHASALLVSSGQWVEQGEAVIRVGSTGNSTGSHLHFEVIVNGETQNPRNFLP